MVVIRLSTENPPVRLCRTGGFFCWEDSIVTEILTLSEVLSVVKCSRSTLYVLMKSGGFPGPLKVGRDNRWLASEVDLWIEKQATARVA